METITNLTQSASKAIWGDSATTEEPVSGVTGDVSKGEPYDAGNIGEHKEYQDEPISTEHISTEHTSTDHTSTAPALTEPASTEHTSTDHTSTAPALTETASTAPALTEPASTEPASTEHDISHEDAKHASETKDSSTESGDLSKAQIDTRHPDDPNTNPEDSTTKARNTVDDTTGGTDENTNPDKIDGPGPKPIAEVAKEHGGDAGNANDSADKKEGDAPTGAADDEDDDGPQTTSHGEGTGEQYVKSSGLKADGGDFDAAAPGAGREADRLLEEKGVHKEDNTVAAAQSNESVESKGSSASSGKEKTSLKDKIKAKFHKSSQ